MYSTPPRRWTRPLPTEPYCAILSVADGSFLSLCRGRYEVSNPDVDVVEGDPPIEECCRGCVGALLGARTLTPIERPMPAVDVTGEVFGAVELDRRPVARMDLEVFEAIEEWGA